MQLKNTVALSFKPYALKTMITSVIFLKMSLFLQSYQ